MSFRPLLLAALLATVPIAITIAVPTASAFCQTQSLSAGGATFVVTYDNGRGYTCRASVDVYACHPEYLGGSGLHPGRVVFVCDTNPLVTLP